MGGSLKAEVKAISAYSKKVSQLSDPTAGIGLTQMTSFAYQAFGGMTSAGQFAEGPMMIAAVQRNSALFEQFMQDLETGIMAIASAAQVCADTYLGADGENAGGINTINYAFGDPGVSRPNGLSKMVDGKTILDLQMEAQANGGGTTPDAVIAPDSGRTVVSFSNYTLTIYPDGSSRTVTTSEQPGGGTQTETVTRTANGTIIGSTTDGTYYLPSYAGGGGSVRTIESKTGGVTTGTVITTAWDGTKTVQPTRNGKPEGDPIVVPPDQNPDSGQEGPVQEALQQYKGWDIEGVKDYGDAQPVYGESYWGGAGMPQQYEPTVPAPTPGTG